MISIGSTLRHLRKAKNVTQEELAEALGVTPQAVSKWENNAGMPDISLLVPLANYFRVSMDTLFGRDSTLTEEQVTALDSQIRDASIDPYTKFERYNEALRSYPDHPILLRGVVTQAARAVTSAATPQNSRLLTEGLRAAERYLIHDNHSPYAVRIKESRIRLLTKAGHYAEATTYSQEFAGPILTENGLTARICRERGDIPEEIRYRQENVAQLAVALADEIAQLGEAYRKNHQYNEAVETHTVNLALPYLLHGEGKYHAPLMNFHALSGFDEAYCLVLSEQYEEALTLLERIFDYAEDQCPRSTNREPLTSPLFSGIHVSPFHGECREADYLHHIQDPVFVPLRSHPRFETLLARYAAYEG